MKIALISRGVGKGGIGRYSWELANRLAQKHELHLFSTYFDYNHNPDIIYRKVPSINGPLVVNSIPFTLLNTLRFNLLKEDFSVVHSNGGDCINPDVITTHSVHKHGIKFRKDIQKIKGLGFHDVWALSTEFTNYRLRNYKKIIADSITSKNELISCYNVPREDIEVIPLGVDMQEFKPAPKNEFLMQKYKIINDFIIETVATEFRRKGVDVLIYSIYKLIKKGYKIKLLVVGKPSIEGSFRDDTYYRKLANSLGISNQVIFTGLIPNPELPLHYNLADIYVTPTKYDAFNIPLLEAAASELPVITSNIGAAEHIKHEHSGLHLIDHNNVQEIADKIEYLILNPELRREMGKNARKDVSVCSWDNVVKRTEKLYEKLI